jgi:hypothetical protein
LKVITACGLAGNGPAGIVHLWRFVRSVQKIPEPTFFLSPLLGRNNKTWHIMSCINLTSCGTNMDFIIGIFLLVKWLTEQENVWQYNTAMKFHSAERAHNFDIH